jgi:hydroxymethylglutaryl-CoA reductase
MTLYFPSLPVGTVSGGTGYATQKESLEMVKCAAPGMKSRLAGVIVAGSLALEASTSASLANDTFTKRHMRLARGEWDSKL